MMTRYRVSTRYRYPISGHMRHVPISGQKKTPISGHMTRYRVSGWPDIGKNPDIGFGKVPDEHDIVCHPTISYTRHTISYFKNVPTTSYTICTYDVVCKPPTTSYVFLNLRYRIRYVLLVTYDIVCTWYDIVGQSTMLS
jgi:hypothetical protein